MWWKIILYYIFTILNKNFGAIITHRDFWQLKPLNLILEKLTDSFNCVSHCTMHQIFRIFFHVRQRWRWNNLYKCPEILILCFREKIPRPPCLSWTFFLKILCLIPFKTLLNESVSFFNIRCRGFLVKKPVGRQDLHFYVMKNNFILYIHNFE
jgi:hypothetical protein